MMSSGLLLLLCLLLFFRPGMQNPSGCFTRDLMLCRLLEGRLVLFFKHLYN